MEHILNAGTGCGAEKEHGLLVLTWGAPFACRRRRELTPAYGEEPVPGNKRERNACPNE